MNDQIIALVGAGGKMGSRIRRNLSKQGLAFIACESDKSRADALRAENLRVMSSEDALEIADIVILALPDAAIPKLSAAYLELLKPGAIVITLDPAAARAGLLAMREDCAYYVVHPCHPSLYAERVTPEEKADLFGGIAAVQDIVLAHVAGSADDYDHVEALCRIFFSPVGTAHRITVEQMAILEPAAAEVVVAMCAVVMKEAIDESVRRGVPRAAAEAFLLGHIQIPLAIVLRDSNPFSDAALIAIEYGKKHVLKENWKDVFKDEKIEEVLLQMLRHEPGKAAGER